MIYYILPTDEQKKEYSESFLSHLGDQKISNENFVEVVQEVCDKLDQDNVMDIRKAEIKFENISKQAAGESPNDLLARILASAKLLADCI